MTLKITFISDTHTKHKYITSDLPGGDIIIHSGDLSSLGYEHEIREFAKWYDGLHQYDNKIFIAGNHDWGFQNNTVRIQEIINSYKNIIYLQDDFVLLDYPTEKQIKIYGSPWQPEFCNWAFNLPRNGWELAQKWNDIPNDTDILITHGPSFGYVDKVIGGTINLGCELLAKRIEEFKPKIHASGHIHTGRGYVYNGSTHFINASVLNEKYEYANKPLNIEWDPGTNDVNFF